MASASPAKVLGLFVGTIIGVYAGGQVFEMVRPKNKEFLNRTVSVADERESRLDLAEEAGQKQSTLFTRDPKEAQRVARSQQLQNV